MDFDWNTTTQKMHVLKKISVRQMVLILSRLKDKEWEGRRRQAYA